MHSWDIKIGLNSGTNLEFLKSDHKSNKQITPSLSSSSKLFYPQEQLAFQALLGREAWQQTRTLCCRGFTFLKKSSGHETLSRTHRTCRSISHLSFRWPSSKSSIQELPLSRLEKCKCGESDLTKESSEQRVGLWTFDPSSFPSSFSQPH